MVRFWGAPYGFATSGRSVEIFAQWSYDLFARISPLSLVPGGLDEHAGKPEIFVVKSGIGHRSEI